MPEGLVNLYGLNSHPTNSDNTNDILSYFTTNIITNNSNTRWPDNSYGTFNSSC